MSVTLPRSGFFQRLPVAGKLMVVSGAAIVLLLGVAFTIVTLQTRSSVGQVSTDMATAEARANSWDVANDLDAISSTAEAMGIALSHTYSAGRQDRQDITRAVKPYADTSKLSLGSWYLAEPNGIGSDSDAVGQPGSSPGGHFMPYWVKRDGQLVLDGLEDSSYGEPFYTLAHDSGRPTIIEPYEYESNGTKTTMTSLAFPVKSGDRVVGVTGIDIALDDLADRLGKIQPFGVGKVMLVSAGGNWVAHPDAAKRMKPYADEGKDKLDQVLKTGEPASFHLTGADGADWVRFIQPVQLANFDTRWAIVSDVPASAISAPATRLGWALVATGIIVTIGLLIALLLAARRLVGRPVHAVSEAVDRLAQGQDVAVPELDRADEIGTMARAAEVFRRAAADRAAADARNAAEQRQVTETVGSGLRALSEGDLTASITADFPPAYCELKTNFNDALGALRGLIGAVTESAAGIRNGSHEIAQASDDLARRTGANAASLEETSAALVQIDGRLRASATSAGKTVERANGTIQVVEGGRTMADDAVSAMGRVLESAKGIDGVIEALDKIAFQTRVLAMNAAVEAGRAGEAGRGFAVVADLVSALAMRAEEEARRAHEQLAVAQADVDVAVGAVEKVGGAFAEIIGEVQEVHTLLDTMASDNQAQSAAISEITAAIASMDQATQQNAAMVEETSAAAANLLAESDQLGEKAATFRTGGVMGRAVRSLALQAQAAAVLH